MILEVIEEFAFENEYLERSRPEYETTKLNSLELIISIQEVSTLRCLHGVSLRGRILFQVETIPGGFESISLTIIAHRVYKTMSEQPTAAK